MTSIEPIASLIVEKLTRGDERADLVNAAARNRSDSTASHNLEDLAELKI